jgi:hypothetical protein
MARIKEIVSLDGKKGTRVAKGRGKRYSRKMSDKELALKNQKNKVMVFGSLGKNTNIKRKAKKGKVYTGGGF